MISGFCCHAGCCWEGALETYETHLGECAAKRLQELDEELRVCRQASSRSAEELLQLRGQLSALQRDVAADRAEQVRERKEMQSLVENLNAELAERAHEVRDKQAALDNSNRIIERRENKILAQRDLLKRLSRQLDAKDRAVKEHLLTIDMKCEEIDRVTKTCFGVLELHENYKMKVQGRAAHSEKPPRAGVMGAPGPESRKRTRRAQCAPESCKIAENPVLIDPSGRPVLDDVKKH